MILISNDFCQIKMYSFEPYNALLAIATNIPVLLMSVLQSHILVNLSCLSCQLFGNKHYQVNKR